MASLLITHITQDILFIILWILLYGTSTTYIIIVITEMKIVCYHPIQFVFLFWYLLILDFPNFSQMIMFGINTIVFDCVICSFKWRWSYVSACFIVNQLVFFIQLHWRIQTDFRWTDVPTCFWILHRWLRLCWGQHFSESDFVQGHLLWIQ